MVRSAPSGWTMPISCMSHVLQIPNTLHPILQDTWLKCAAQAEPARCTGIVACVGRLMPHQNIRHSWLVKCAMGADSQVW